MSDQPQDALRDLTYEKISDYAREVIAQAPPRTQEQRNQLSSFAWRSAWPCCGSSAWLAARASVVLQMLSPL
jgi:hypothetical protein